MKKIYSYLLTYDSYSDKYVLRKQFKDLNFVDYHKVGKLYSFKGIKDRLSQDKNLKYLQFDNSIDDTVLVEFVKLQKEKVGNDYFKKNGDGLK